MILFSFFGSFMIAGVIAVLFERWGWTHNGIVPSILLSWGAVVVLFFIRSLFGFTLGSPGLDAIVGSAAVLFLIPTDLAAERLRRNRRKR